MTRFFGTVASAAANSTWRDSSWAMSHLQPHAGRVLRVELVPPFASSAMASFAMRVTAEGNWEPMPSTDGAEADAILRVDSKVGFDLAHRPDKPGAALNLRGSDPGFIAALRDLHDVLPLAIEDRIAALTGPIAAHALLTTLRLLARWPAQAADRVGAGATAWMSEERHLALTRPLFRRFSRDVEALDARMSRLVEQHRL